MTHTDEPTMPADGASPPPQTDDIVIDSALADLAGVDQTDLDGVLGAGEAVHRTLQGRLADLGG